MQGFKELYLRLMELFWSSRMKTKIFMICIPLALVCVTLICTATYSFSSKLLVERILNEADLRSQLIARDVYQDTRDLIHNEFSIMTATSLLASGSPLENREELSNRTRELFSGYEGVSVSYFDSKGKCILSHRNVQLSAAYDAEEPEVRQFLAGNQSKAFLSPVTIHGQTYISHIARMVPESNSMDLAYMVIHMDTSRYTVFLEAQADYFDSIVVLRGNDNEIIEVVNAEQEHRVIAEGLSNIKRNSYGEYVTIDKTDYYIKETEDENYHWKTVFLIPMTDVGSELSPVLRNTAVIMIIFVLLMFLLFLALSKILTRPLERITRDLSSESGKPYQLTHFHAKHNDEIGTLVKAFEKKEQQIEHYIQELTELEKKYREAEEFAFTSQMNPHLLYNTLSTIIWLIEDGQKTKAIDATQALATLLQNSLRHDRELIPIQKEMETLKSYIAIQQLRYYDRFRCILLVDDELMQHTIPGVVLQPLFENAIYHGIKLRTTMGVIKVTGRREGNDICISIADNGPADEQAIRRINHGLADPAAGDLRIGTKNVHLRLRYRYGEPYGLSYKKEGEFTVATIRIPAGKENGNV